MKICINQIIPPSVLQESESIRRALIGARLRVDAPAIAAIRERSPGISPCPPETWEVPLEEVLQALIALRRIEAAVDWNIIQPILVRIPFTCADQVITV